MKKLLIVCALICSINILSGCSNMNNRQTAGMVGGGVLGGVAGNLLTGGSAVGTGIGAVGGALVGNELAK